MSVWKNPRRLVWHTLVCSRCGRIISRNKLPGLQRVASQRVCDRCLAGAPVRSAAGSPGAGRPALGASDSPGASRRTRRAPEPPGASRPARVRRTPRSAEPAAS